MNTKVSIKQSRFYNFDLLKIILMYGIVIFHIVAGGVAYLTQRRSLPTMKF